MAAGIYAITSGILTLLGWVFDIQRLMDWNNSGITMKANAAICVMLLGLALVMAVDPVRYRVAIRATAGFAALIAFLTLSEHLLGIDIGIDTLLFDESAGAPATAAPGRMGPPAATTFTMLGTALIFTTGSRRTRRAAGWIGIVALTISTLPLLGYLYGASQLYGIARVTGIAFQTATVIAVLSIGVVTVAREFGLIELIEGETAGSMMFRRLALPLVLVSLFIGWLRVVGQEAGLYDTAFGTAARTLLEILVVLGLLWWTARGVTRAEKKLRDADRRKDEFIATLSHELRNPLAPIRSAVEILRHKRSGTSELAISRDMIDRQVTHMSRLIDDLLDVGRITRNKVELRKETVDIGDMIRQAIETARPLLEERGHRLSLELPPSPVYLDADPVRITQILANLLNNACKFTEPNGEIFLKVETSDTDVKVSIRDTGKGIPGDRLANVFEMFAQVDGSSGVNHSGLGIGLNLTKHLVELHGGVIEATSGGEGCGSTFTVRLPRTFPEVAPAESKKAVLDDSASAKLRVLIVDDNLDAAESLVMMMRLAGNEAEMAHDGGEAVERAKALHPDVILLDIGLPIMDGYEVCRTIRKEPWGGDVCIVALTGWGQDEDRRRTKEAGFDAHLVKPVDPVTLVEMIGKTRSLSAGNGRGTL
ncbi:MAG TPA: ATP-binding protein [Pyrinomonadaceae bacterium]